MPNRTKTELFHIGENLAANYLSKQGYAILRRNFRGSHGEVDIIAQIGDLLVFVEVKTRSHPSQRLALMSVAYTKRLRLTATAREFLQNDPAWEECRTRFDIIIVLYHPASDTFRIRHYEDAFLPVFAKEPDSCADWTEDD